MNTVDNTKYVVLDVETNGLNSGCYDLLSISLYRPDIHKFYDRFLPLERQNDVYTTWINGITKKDLRGEKPLNQDEVDQLIKDFELDKRIILTYGRIDRTFLQNYFRRKGLNGFHLFKFYNFKRSIISSPFSGGVITKDALCNVFGIKGVSSIHSGRNDCLLEWKLFEKMNDGKLFIDGRFKVYRFSDEYIVPASYLAYYSNFKYHSNSCVDVTMEYKTLKKFKIRSNQIRKFETNIDGVAIEHLLSTMLKAEDYKKEEREQFLYENKKRLEYIGKIPSPLDYLFVKTNKDGTLTAVNKKDEEKINQINIVLEEYKKGATELVSYLKKDIFKNKTIRYQELVVNQDTKTLALCDFSNEEAVLEMKTYGIPNNDKGLAHQLYYQSNGRDVYILSMKWYKSGVDFIVSKVTKQFVKEKRIQPLIYQAELNKPHRKTSEINAISRKKRLRKEKITLTEEQKLERRIEKYKQRVAEESNGTIEILNYINSRTNVKAKCLTCGQEWEARSDKIPTKGCPKCRKLFRKMA